MSTAEPFVGYDWGEMAICITSSVYRAVITPIHPTQYGGIANKENVAQQQVESASITLMWYSYASIKCNEQKSSLKSEYIWHSILVSNISSF